MKKGKAKRLVLFDAHAIVHRAYHALPDFTTKKGEPTGGLYGLTSMLLKAIQELAPDYIAACYDLPGPTFRHKAYAEYKAGRAKADDELKAQLSRSRDIFKAFSIPIYDSPGFEADDMIGTIVETTKKDGDLEVVIVTGDMDTLQLVSGDHVRVFTLKKGINDTVLYNEEKVRERFGFGPELLTDYKGLRGDPSDNIVGVRGIGEKTAGQLIQEFGGIERIYGAINDPKKITKAGIKERVVTLLREQEDEAKFSKMLATIRRDAPIEYEIPKMIWKDSFELSKALTLMKELEFASIAERMKRIFGTGDSPQEKGKEGMQAALIPANDAPDALEVKKVGIALWLIDSDRTNPTIEEIYEYTETADFTVAKKHILGALKGKIKEVYETIELPLIPIIARAEAIGIRVDVAFLENLSREYHELLDAVAKEIFRDAGNEFNINSPKQLSEVLFEKLGLSQKGLKKTEGGARSTRESELEKLRDTHPIIGKILKYREIQKLLSTYIDTIPKMVDADGRLHTTLHQAGTTTGRMSSSNPNLQNIPVREGMGAHLRNAFVAGEGCTLLSFDYSQIEMRVLAMLSNDPGLIEIFRKGDDIHTSVASRVFRVPPSEVTREMRRRAKVINFGIVYGMGVNALRENLGSSREEAQEFYDQYFATFPKIAAYFDDLKKIAAKQGYTETLFGRRRIFRDIRSKIPYIRAQAERMVMNAPIQGTAADIVKIAMARVDQALKKAGLVHDAELLLQVHDELIYEVTDKAKTIERVEESVRIAMESVCADEMLSRGVPLEVDVKKGKRWGEMETIPN